MFKLIISILFLTTVSYASPINNYGGIAETKILKEKTTKRKFKFRFYSECIRYRGKRQYQCMEYKLYRHKVYVIKDKVTKEIKIDEESFPPEMFKILHRREIDKYIGSLMKRIDSFQNSEFNNSHAPLKSPEIIESLCLNGGPLFIVYCGGYVPVFIAFDVIKLPYTIYKGTELGILKLGNRARKKNLRMAIRHILSPNSTGLIRIKKSASNTLL